MHFKIRSKIIKIR